MSHLRANVLPIGTTSPNLPPITLDRSRNSHKRLGSRSPSSTPHKISTVIDDDGVQDDFSYFMVEDFDEMIARRKLQYIKDTLRISRETVWDRLPTQLSPFKLDIEAFRNLTVAVQDEITRGLQANVHHPNVWLPSVSSFRMIDTYLKHLPLGCEKGIAYAIHVDAVRVRITRADLRQDRRSSVVYDREWRLGPAGLLEESVSQTLFFDCIVEWLQQMMLEHDDVEKHFERQAFELFPLCLSFAFPILQRSLTSAVLVEWTGAMKAGRAVPEDPIEGCDVCAALSAAISRTNTPARVIAYSNETVAALYHAAFDYASHLGTERQVHRECLLGVVVGAGMNACYYEAHAQAHYGFEGAVIDLECGNLNRGLPLTAIDYELDFSRPQTQGRNLLEKMTAMGYMGEVARRLLVQVLQDKCPSAAWQEGSLTALNVIDIADDSSVGKDETRRVIVDAWGRMPAIADAMSSGLEDRTGRKRSAPGTDTELVSKCCWAVVDRAAALTAATMIGIAKHTGHLRASMAQSMLLQHRVRCRRFGFVIGGPLFRRCETFRERLRYWLAEGVRDGSQIGGASRRGRNPGVDIIEANDPQGLGLALIAATVAATDVERFSLDKGHSMLSTVSA